MQKKEIILQTVGSKPAFPWSKSSPPEPLLAMSVCDPKLSYSVPSGCSTLFFLGEMLHMYMMTALPAVLFTLITGAKVA
jgi:hypothetical protein